MLIIKIQKALQQNREKTDIKKFGTLMYPPKKYFLDFSERF